MAKQSVDQVLLKANSHAKKGEIAEAQELYQAVLSQFPQNKRAQKGLAALVKPSLSAIRKDPPQESIQQLISLYNQGLVTAVVEQAQSLAVQYPNAFLVWNILGAAHKGLGNIEEAAAAFQKVTELNPNSAEGYNNLGVAFKDQGKLEEAIASYTKALAIKPDYASANYNMGIVLQGKGKHQDAIASYEKALSVKPDYPEAYYYMGIAWQEQGNLDQAVASYEKAVLLKPDYAEAYYNMGVAVQDQGNLDQAIAWYEKAVLFNPDYDEAYYNLGVGLNNQDKTEEAIFSFNQVLALKPDHSEASHMLAILTGQKTKSMPKKFVEGLFDEYAARFDQSLVGDLEYDIPEVLTQLVVQKHGSGSLGSILDLGCGTGLTGEKIRGYCARLEGIDLSNEMLEQARNRKVYDKVEHADIVEYLSDTELDFDYFFSTDVFVYVGDLSEVFRLIKARNKRPGKLVFTTEHTEKDGFHLEKSVRYSHSLSYIEGLCEKFQFSISHFSETNLRKEKGVFLKGGLYVLDF